MKNNTIILWKISALLACCIPLPVSAQNTIGGIQKEVPAEELRRQSEFLTAEKERMLGRHEQAIDAYKKFLYNNEKNDAAWYGLARSYTDQKNYGNALEAIDKAINLSKENKWYYLLKADIYEKNAQFGRAADMYDLLSKRFPDTPEFYERLAYLSTLAEQPKDALKALDKLEKITSVTELTASRKHLIYVALGDNKKAANELQRLIDVYPSRIDYQKSLAKFYAEIGDNAAAKSTWKAIQERWPQDSEAQIATLEKKKGNNSDVGYLQSLEPLFKDPGVNIDLKIKELVPYFDKINPSADPDLITAATNIAEILETTHKEEPKAWSVSGDLFYLAGKDDAALLRYKRCISLKPRVFSVWDNALTILDTKKQYAEMMPLAEQAMDAFPNQPKAYYYYGVAANALNKPGEALPLLEQATFMCGNNTALLLDVTNQIGVALLAQKNYDAVIARFDKVMAKGGDKHPGILRHYGDALAGKGDKKGAEEYWKKAGN